MLPAGMSRWEDACTVAAILAVDPFGIGGVALRSAAGPVRDQWLQYLTRLTPEPAVLRRIPLNVSDQRLLGGLDLAATLRRGRPVAESGLLAEADGGIAILAMAERLSAASAAKIGAVLDTHEVILERDGFARRIAARFGVIALDEGIEPDERPPQLLLDRLALHVDLNGVACSAAVDGVYSRRDVARARRDRDRVSISDDLLVGLTETAEALGIVSARACIFALRVARAVAALDGRVRVVEEDAATAARLVFAPRATKVPSQESEQKAESTPECPEHPEPPQPEAADSLQPESADSPPANDPGTPVGSLTDRVLQAALATLPPDFLAYLQGTAATRTAQSRQSGRTSTEHDSRQRGRPSGIRAGDPRTGARMSVIDTLRAAAPWQRIRRSKHKADKRIRVLKEDFRVTRFKRRNQLTTIFLVDASGSAAFNRLAEVKGAVELMLADSYVRRDRVALIAFRGAGAQILLPPTSSLVRAKRELAGLPGGGGTPMALGLDAARSLADSLSRRGEVPIVVVLTDGRPNVARDGKGNRARAEADTISAARMMRSNSINSLMVDTAPQPRIMTENFAREMGARYVPLPHVDAGMLAGMVRQCGAGPNSRPQHGQLHG